MPVARRGNQDDLRNHNMAVVLRRRRGCGACGNIGMPSRISRGATKNGTPRRLSARSRAMMRSPRSVRVSHPIVQRVILSASLMMSDITLELA